GHHPIYIAGLTASIVLRESSVPHSPIERRTASGPLRASERAAVALGVTQAVPTSSSTPPGCSRPARRPEPASARSHNRSEPTDSASRTWLSLLALVVCCVCSVVTTTASCLEYAGASARLRLRDAYELLTNAAVRCGWLLT